jgi:hypothetical protein
MMMRQMFGVMAVVAALALSTVARADSAIDGTWQFNLQTDGGPRDVTVVMKADGDQVTGKWDTTDLKGTFSNNTLALKFPLTSAEANMTADLIIDGTLEGDALKGTWKFGEYSGTFTATKKPQ